MSNVVRFPDRDSDDDVPEPATLAEQPETDDEAELFILNLYRSKSHHPAGSKLPHRRAE